MPSQTEPLYIEGRQLTLDNAQDMLEEQVQQMIQLEQTKQERESEVAETEWKLTSCQEEVCICIFLPRPLAGARAFEYMCMFASYCVEYCVGMARPTF